MSTGICIFLKSPGAVLYLAEVTEGCDATDVLRKAIEKGVVFVTGKTFDPDGACNDHMRVSFCNTDIETIHRGIPLIAEAIRELYG